MEPAGVEHAGFRYQPPLDGLRAVAVLAVLGYHYGAGSGGYLGVDIFLVLSGYLITSLLAIELSSTGRIGFLSFWARRVRRLLPALLVLVLLVALYAVFAAPVEQLARVRSDGLATLFYVQNWHMIRAGTQPSPLSHTWSLAIEEQWYLIWPPVFLGLSWLCRGRRRLLIGVVLFLALLSALEMSRYGPSLRAYYGTDTRAQALLLGAALALLLQVKSGPVRRGTRVGLELVGVASLITVVVMAAKPPSWMYQGGFLLVAIAVAFVIAASVQRESPVLGRALSITPLRWLGLISYGVYLYHFPVLRWLNESRTGLSVVPLTLVRFTVTVAIATLSFVLIERPIRRGTFLPRRAQLVATPFVVALVAMVLIATTVGATSVEVLSPTGQLWTYLRNNSPSGARRVVVLGDRDVSDLALTMHGPYEAPGVEGLSIGSTTCRLEDLRPSTTTGVDRACTAWWKQVRDALDAYRPGTVLMQFGGNESAVRDHEAAPAERARRIQAALKEIRRTMLHRSAHIVLVSSPCSDPGAEPAADPAPDPGAQAWLTDVLRTAATKDPTRVSVLALPGTVCTSDGGTLAGEPVRTPAGALTPGGAHTIWKWITDSLPLVR